VDVVGEAITATTRAMGWLQCGEKARVKMSEIDPLKCASDFGEEADLSRAGKLKGKDCTVVTKLNWALFEGYM
jgi:hypothetical protein